MSPLADVLCRQELDIVTVPDNAQIKLRQHLPREENETTKRHRDQRERRICLFMGTNGDDPSERRKLREIEQRERRGDPHEAYVDNFYADQGL